MNGRRWAALAGLVLFLLWWLFVFGSYYAIQKPAPPAQFPALLRAAWNLAAAALIVAGGAGLGRLLLRAAGLSSGTRLERALFSAGVGLGALGLLVFALGLAGWLHPAVLGALFAVSAAAGLAQVARGLRRRPLQLAAPPRGLAVYLGLMGGMALLIALAPPLSFDSLVYHLTGPQLYLQAGGIRPGLDLLHLNYPALTEMLYTLALAVAGEGAAAPIHWAYGLLAGLSVLAITARWFGRRTGWLGLAVWASMPMVFVLAGWAYNDLALAFYQMLAMLAVLRWREDYAGRWLILAGLAMGLALSQKYTSAFGAAALGALILWDAGRAKWPAGRALCASSAFVAPALLVAAPWYIKNWAFTGNPVYPFLFDGRFWDDFRRAWYQRPGSGLGWDLQELALLPWTATIGLRAGNAYDGQIGPLFLVLLPLLLAMPFVARWRSRSAGALLWVAGVLAAAWTAGVIGSRSLLQMRLLLPCLTLLSPLTAALIADFEPRLPINLSLRRLLLVSLGLILLANVLSFTLRLAAIQPLPALLGLEDRQSYLERNLGQYAVAMQALSARLPAGSKTLFLWEARAYYATRPAAPDAIVDHWPRLVYRLGDADAIAAALRGDGYSHLLVHRLGMDFLRADVIQAVSDRDLEVWEEFKARHLRALEWPAAPAYELYAIISEQ